MITYKKVKTSKPFAYTCDKCGKTYEIDGTFADQMEAQEFLHINFTGGYGSIFGDMNHVEADICQFCLKPLIGGFARTSSKDYRDRIVPGDLDTIFGTE